MVKAVKGTLVKCDASIKAMLVRIDNNNNNDFIIEDLDDEHLLVKDLKVGALKARLKEMLKDKLKDPGDEVSDQDAPLD